MSSPVPKSKKKKKVPFMKAINTKPSVLICIPMYDEKIAGIGMASVSNGMETLRGNGYKCSMVFVLGDPYLDQARNKLVKAFLDSGFTDMIFVDSDLSFDADAFLKLMKHDVTICGGSYPFRVPEKDGFPIKPKLDENRRMIINNGIIECDHIPTGMMRIRRDTFGILKKKYPHRIDNEGLLQFFGIGLIPMYEETIKRLIDKINNKDFSIGNIYEKADNRWYGEDVYFCKICIDAGIKVWCDPTITFVHIGTNRKTGNYLEYLNKKDKEGTL